MKTRCSRCRRLIEFGNTMCDECKSCVIKNKKKNINNKEIEATTKSSEWKATRRKTMQRDNNCCVLCWHLDKRVTMTRLEVHHIVKRVNDPSLIYDLDNLVTVCKYHHEELEKLSVKEQKEILQGLISEISYNIL